MFVDFEDVATGKHVAVNRDHILAVYHGDEPGVCVLIYGDKAKRDVKGQYQEIVDKLNRPCPTGT